ncbi:hypothetical protein DICVIV_04159 [Dictyocaulus viviparus]|uniref:Major facilitator superfamily (MFS) profile domain-containing protein n=1 Tax=Dictyocaulus viviparus TaxID=29172 RepID=A0A0D8Y0N0_DICVI|nr:hypothetical protein DICVIV_04159 [Dictyocaulus viviparus]
MCRRIGTIMCVCNVAQLSSSFLMVLFTCSCIIATLIVDKIPRRAMLLTAGTSCIFSLCTFVIAADYGFKYVAMAGIFAFVFSYGIGVGPISWSIPPELVPLQNRSAMFCLCYAVHSVLVVLTNFSTIPLLETIGTVCFLPIYIIPCSLALMYVYAHLPETKGRDPLDILHELRGMSIKERMVDA